MSQTSYAELRGLRLGAGTARPWASMPTGFTNTNERASVQSIGMDGQRFLGSDFIAPRTVAFDIHLIAATAEERLALVDELLAAWGPVRDGIIPLTIALNGVERLLLGRPARCDVDMRKLQLGSLRARCTFESSDPRLYSADVSSLVLGLVAGGGRTYPKTYPKTYGAGSDSDGSAINAGTTNAPWTATIVGPVTTPRLTLGETGEFIELDGDIPAGSTLIVDSATQSVLFDGSPRPSWPTPLSRWWSLPAGTNTIRFRAASGTGSCTFAWRSAWL